MKRVKYSDIRFKVNPKLVYVKNFTMRFYTISSRYYFFEKTEQDVIEVEREATVDDVDVILSGGTKVTEYYIPIEWDELLNVGEGVLNYRVTNNIEDPEFPDHYYNKEITVTTDFYIDCDIHVDPEPAEGLIERIVALEEHLDEEIVNREAADSFISGAVDTEIARAISAETELSEALTSETSRAISAETVLDEKIDAETNRATSAETALDEKVDQEIADRIADVNAEEARAISAETVLQEALDAEETRASGEEQRIENKLDQEIADRIADVNAEETRATNAETALNAKIDAETNRATSAETALNEALQAETNRAISAETALDTKIDQEIQDRKDDVDAEETRAINAESALTDAINAEANRAISAETELSNAIINETNRATSAETALSSKIDADVLAEENRAKAAETALDGKITSVSGAVSTEVARAISAETALQTAIDELSSGSSAAIDAEIARATSAETQLGNRIDSEASARTDADTALSNKIDSLSGTVDTKLADKADKVDAVASAEYVSSAKTINLKNISGTVISTIDATDFIKDGMVDDVKIENGYLVITFNTDAGKESISIALTDIFNPNNYYTKTEIDNTVSGINTSIANEVSARTDADTALQTAITNEVSRAREAESGITNSLNAEVTRATGAEAALDGKITSVSGAVDALSGIVTGHTSDSVIHVTSSDKEKWNKVDEKADTTALTAVNDALTAHTADSVAHITAAERTAWNAKADESAFTAHTADTTIHLTSGNVQTQIDNSISGKADSSDVYLKSETSGATEIATALNQKLSISDFNIYSGTVDTLISSKASQSDLDALNSVVTAHTANTTVHVTSNDKAKWNKVDDKLDITDFNTYSASTDSRIGEDEEVTAAALNQLNESLNEIVNYINILKNNNIDKFTAQYDSATDTWYLSGGEY